MTEVLKMIASGIAAIGTPVARKDYPKLDKMPFTSDRLRLRGDYDKVMSELKKSIETVKKDNGSETYRR